MQPYPSSGQAPEPSQAPRIAPRPVLNAVKLMWAGAVIEAITLVIGLATIASTKVAIHKDNPKLTSQQIATSVNVDLGYVALSIVLWIVISLACRRGQSWARITGTVLFGLNTLGGALSLRTKDGYSAPGVSLEANYGSHDRRAATAEGGGHTGSGLYWYGTANTLADDGWRDASPTEATQVFVRFGCAQPRLAPPR